MANSEAPLEQLKRYGRVARNSQMLLVMEPSPGADDVEKAREAISEDALSYLGEIEEGVQSPYFTTYTRQDARYIDFLAAEKVRQVAWDRLGVFEVSEPRIHVAETSQAQAATFAYLAASCMRLFKAPFYQAPGLRAAVRSPRNLAEFVGTVRTVKDVTHQSRGRHFQDVVARNDWRVAFTFWEANKWLAQTMRVGKAS